MPPTLYSADVLCPMSGPPVPDGGVLVDNGVITAVGAAADLVAQAARRHHVDGALLPGLVNGHTHLELADAAPLAVPGPFASWVHAVDGMSDGWSDETWGRSAHRGVLQALRAGATTVFDTVTRGPAVPAAVRAAVGGTSFVEIRDVDATHAEVVAGQVEHALGLPAEGRGVGIGVLSPVRVGTGVLQRMGQIAQQADAPLQLHAAESDAEVTALRLGTGPLVERARSRGLDFEWLPGGAPTPVRYLEAVGVLGPRTSLVSAVKVDAGEARLLAKIGVPVVCCPRANRRLGMGTAPLELYAEAGVRLALGTESLAAVPDLDLLAEAAAWVDAAEQRGLHLWATAAGPVPLTEAAIRLATIDGAQALGWGDRCGVLEAGRRADLVGVEIATTPDSVYSDLVAKGAGRQVVTVLAGVRKARRDSAEVAWPPIDDDSWRGDAGGGAR